MADVLLRTIPTFQALALVGYNAQLLKKKKKTASDFVSYGMGNILGTAMTKEVASFIG